MGCRTALDFRKRCPQICCKRENEDGKDEEDKEKEKDKDKENKDKEKEKDKKKEKEKEKDKNQEKNTSQDKGVTCSASLLGKPNQNDCVAEKNNAVRNNQLDALYNRCRTEGGSRPIRVRCPQLCCKNWGDGKKSGKKKNEDDGKKSGKKKNEGPAPPPSNKKGSKDKKG